tara:strand:+ start:327 stop:530 length:204 start_codon:yes stop_codon:yes gene_type:complete
MFSFLSSLFFVYNQIISFKNEKVINKIEEMMVVIIIYLFKKDRWQKINRIVTVEHISFLLKLSGKDN